MLVQFVGLPIQPRSSPPAVPNFTVVRPAETQKCPSRIRLSSHMIRHVKSVPASLVSSTFILLETEAEAGSSIVSASVVEF